MRSRGGGKTELALDRLWSRLFGYSPASERKRAESLDAAVSDLRQSLDKAGSANRRPELQGLFLTLDPIVQIGDDGSVLFANKAFLDAAGESLQKVVGRPLLDIDLPYAGVLVDLFQELRGSEDAEISAKRSYGDYEARQYLSVHGIKLATINGTNGVQMSFSNVTELENLRQMAKGKDISRIKESGRGVKNISILFSDLARFTDYSEVHEANEVIETLNLHLFAMTGCIDTRQGYIDKYIGDAVMALFGANPLLENHACNACLSAVDMQVSQNQLNAIWREDGKPVHHMRLGIDTGNVILGPVGDIEGKFELTTIGDSVNNSARMESMNKNYGSRIIIAENTCNALGERRDRFLLRKLDRVAAKGKERPHDIHELIGYYDSSGEFVTYYRSFDGFVRKFSEVISLYENALALVREGSYDRAIKEFERASDLKSSCEQAAGLEAPEPDEPCRKMIELCRACLLDPPANRGFTKWLTK